eukprot:c45673_g1_i1.p1 GENE.c45673_g1_i1~~c45673_g1_i1.p1  ORF type:complete len:253 (-),score=44.15 c45673_g1_i1:766-1524(-)
MLSLVFSLLVSCASADLSEPWIYSLVETEAGVKGPLESRLVARFYLEGLDNLKLARCSDCPSGSRVVKECSEVTDTVCDFEGCVGVETNPLDSARRYSTIHAGQTTGVGHGQGRLDSPQAWSAVPQNNVPNEWAQLDIGSARPVSHVLIQPRKDGGTGSQRVSKFKVQYSNTDTDQASAWTFVDNGFEFDGPANGINEDTKVRAVFKRVIVARYWRVVPTLISGWTSLRWGVGVCALSGGEQPSSKLYLVLK